MHPCTRQAKFLSGGRKRSQPESMFTTRHCHSIIVANAHTRSQHTGWSGLFFSWYVRVCVCVCVCGRICSDDAQRTTPFTRCVHVCLDPYAARLMLFPCPCVPHIHHRRTNRRHTHMDAHTHTKHHTHGGWLNFLILLSTPF